MPEKIVSPNELSSPGGGSGIFDDSASDSPGMAVVSAGVYAEQIPVAGMSIGEIRHRFADRFDLDPRSQAVLDGQDAGEDVVVRAGQTLMFTHRAGEKGSLPSLPRSASWQRRNHLTQS